MKLYTTIFSWENTPRSLLRGGGGGGRFIRNLWRYSHSPARYAGVAQTSARFGCAAQSSTSVMPRPRWFFSRAQRTAVLSAQLPVGRRFSCCNAARLKRAHQRHSGTPQHGSSLCRCGTMYGPKAATYGVVAPHCGFPRPATHACYSEHDRAVSLMRTTLTRHPDQRSDGPLQPRKGNYYLGTKETRAPISADKPSAES
ncbi:hypothetical protein BD293_3616 [Roseinatronobacter monicus]|uniref:Uncharacterized protein n=1 Tax=Roseinatronobacter monicus TaxID=393481 RepID=A0A543KIN8_9RHOB|nr:hypothetical protein BD293_3616 [Roseinatronobacter monicus]